jgi:hypothetical protein
MHANVIFLSLLLFYIIPTSLSDLCGSTTACDSVEIWRTNILCRLNGGKDADNTRSSGYVFWAMTPTTDEMTNKKLLRQEAVKYFARAELALRNNISDFTPENRAAELGKIERGIDYYGKKIDSNEWDSSKKCGVGTALNYPCGDLKTNPPPCPIP